MADKKYLDEDGLAVVATKVNEKLKVVTTMPATPTNGQVVLYVGTTTATYTQGGIYLYNGTSWMLISTADVDLTPYKKIFTGTRAEWDALSTAEKKAYDEADLTDDTAGGELLVTDAVTAGDLNPVTSNAVANAIASTDSTHLIGKSVTPPNGNTFLVFFKDVQFSNNYTLCAVVSRRSNNTTGEIIGVAPIICGSNTDTIVIDSEDSTKLTVSSASSVTYPNLASWVFIPLGMLLIQ